MKKREFLAMGGAVPLMLAGCGGDTGSAPVRLVNASVGYPLLGFMVDTTQATTADVPYGSASPFETVQAGSVTTALTVTSGTTVSSVSSTVRSLSKDSRYSLIAYGFQDELKSVLLTESTVTPDTGKANINVLNTSVDIGPVDVYVNLTAGTNLSLATQIAANVGGVTTSAAFSLLPGSYFITVVGANSIAEGRNDVRFSGTTAITVVDQEILTIILTPGASGTLANVIVLTQGTSTNATTPQNFTNNTARVRAVTAVPTASTVSVAGVLGTTAAPEYTQYFVVTQTGTPVVADTIDPPVVTVNGAAVAISGATTALAPGGDYTLIVYTDSTGANPVARLILDDNTAPVSTAGVKFRLLNLVYNNQALSLSMSVNSVSIATGIPFATASAYTEVTTPQTTNSNAEVFSGANLLTTHSQVMTAGNIFTEIVVSVDPTATPPVLDFFRSASGV